MGIKCGPAPGSTPEKIAEWKEYHKKLNAYEASIADRRYYRWQRLVMWIIMTMCFAIMYLDDSVIPSNAYALIFFLWALPILDRNFDSRRKIKIHLKQNPEPEVPQ